MKGASAMASEPRYISPDAVTDGERRALAGRDHQIVLAGKDDAECERALQLLQGFAHGGDRLRARSISSEIR